MRLNSLESRYDHQFTFVCDLIRELNAPPLPAPKRRISFVLGDCITRAGEPSAQHPKERWRGEMSASSARSSCVSRRRWRHSRRSIPAGREICIMRRRYQPRAAATLSGR